MEKDQKKLKTTPLGQAVNTVMMEQFPDIVNVKFSADMEKKLDVVEAGQADWVKTIDDFYQGFEKSLEQAEKNMEASASRSRTSPRMRSAKNAGGPWSSIWPLRQVCGVLGLPGVPQRPPHCKGYRRPVPAVRRPYAAAQKRQGPRVLRLQQLPHLQLNDMG